MTYLPFIGLEIHIELATASKMFCGCPAEHFGKAPNTQTCPVCLGLPGALPVPNKKAIEWTLLLGKAVGSKISPKSWFDRKNYFYPDLPKGYQISQQYQPFCLGGKLDGIRLNNIHLEEDTGKLQHKDNQTLVDFNRSGVPLVEIVTEPDFHSIEQVDKFLKRLQRLIRYLGISTADMEKGSMRLEPSISLSTDGKLPKYRVELKNINSFRFVRKALECEIQRQQREPHIMQTRGWSEEKNATFSQREKEEAHDYRYFPEPDIPPFDTSVFSIILPELPDAKNARFMKNYGLSPYQANILTEDLTVANEFEKMVVSSNYTPIEIANSLINKRELPTKSTNAYKPEKIISAITEALTENPQAVVDYKKGKTQVVGFLMGQVAKKLPEADKSQIQSLLEQALTK